MSGTGFYGDLKPFHNFVEGVIQSDHYSPVPGDWLIAVTDVVNSTRAVNAGKYVEVNYLGAACIVAAGNAVPELTLASVFGGDGATLVMPPEAREPDSAALLSVKRWGRSAFGLELRVGIEPGFSFSSTLRLLIEQKAHSSLNMPKGKQMLPAKQIETIGRWTDQGAKNN